MRISMAGVRRKGVLSLALACVVAVSAACSRKTDDDVCPNLPVANGLLGQADYGTGTPNAGGRGAARLNSAVGSVASNGALTYVADTGNNRILGYNSQPSGVAAPANFVLGQGDATGTDFSSGVAAAGASALSAPSKVTVSAAGQLVVADTGNNRVLIWNTLPTANTPPNVVVGQPDFNSNRANQRLAAPTAATLSNPTSAMIANGFLVVVDQGNHRVLIWNTVPVAANTPADVELGQAASTTSGTTTTACTANNGTNGFCFTTAIAGVDATPSGAAPVLALNAPSDVWTDGFRLLISDSGNNRVLYWSQLPANNNAFYTYVMGQAQPGQATAGATAQKFNAPWGIWFDTSNLFVADAGNNRVLQFSGFPLQHNPVAFGVFGQGDFTHVAANDSDQNGAPGSQQGGQSGVAPAFNTLSSPTGVYATSGGQLFVTDRNNHRVMLFTVGSAVNGTVPSDCNGINPPLD